MHFPIDRTVHTTAFDKPVVDHWLERKIAQTAAGSTEKDRSDDRPLQRRARYRLSYIPLFMWIRNSSEQNKQKKPKKQTTTTFVAAFNKLLNAIGDICERIFCPKLLFLVTNKFMGFVLCKCLFSRYHDIRR